MCRQNLGICRQTSPGSRRTGGGRWSPVLHCQDHTQAKRSTCLNCVVLVDKTDVWPHAIPLRRRCFDLCSDECEIGTIAWTCALNATGWPDTLPSFSLQMASPVMGPSNVNFYRGCELDDVAVDMKQASAGSRDNKGSLTAASLGGASVKAKLT